MSEILNLIVWYVVLTGIGVVSIPIGFYFLRFLSDRGYAFTRAVGLLLWSYLFWLLGNLNFLHNDLGGLLLAMMGVIALSIWSYSRVGGKAIRTWFKENRRVVITVEVLTLFAFLLMAFLRANNPDITGTEKPMELAFINAILRSPRLPPLDPWLSGYSISYYHFGYIMVAMLAKFSATPGSVAFNLGITTVFALGAAGAYGILYTLLDRRRDNQDKTVRSHLQALWAPFFLLVVSNLEVVLHWMHTQGWFWHTQVDGTRVSSFWQWLQLERLMSPPQVPKVALDRQFWWWWQASRVVQDFDYTGANKGDVIDEFPNFSFLLADLHPHVLAIPFVLLAIAFVLNYFLNTDKHSLNVWRWKLDISTETWLTGGLVLGALAFLNTWDFPFYVALLGGSYVLKQMLIGQREWKPLIGQFVLLGLLIGLTSLLMYLPFFISFSSQAGGLLPNIIFITRGVYTWIMFAPLLIPIIAFLLHLWRRNPRQAVIRKSILTVLVLTGSLLLLSLFIVLIIVILPLFSSLNPQAAIAPATYLNSVAAPDWGSLIVEGFLRRFTVPGTLLTIGLILVFCLAVIYPPDIAVEDGQDEGKLITSYLPNYFVLLMILLGALLVFGPEFVYLRDLFGYRINTIFKFYFQTWILWSLASAYIVSVLWRRIEGVWRFVFQALVVLVVGASLLYPYFGFLERTNRFQPSKGLTLDGAAYLETINPDEVAAMRWLRQAPLGVIAEAVGGSYSQFARFSIHTGHPTVLGWDFHEVQWRGGNELLGSRRADIERLYCTPRWEEASEVISTYGIRYVAVGSLEHNAYGQNNPNCPNGLQENKLIENLTLAFEQGMIRIYAVP